jgi:SAM-dependent methyltransferase
MRKTIINLIDIISKTLPVYEPIYEFGALQVPGQEAFTDIRAMFPDKKYFGCDMRMGPRVDLILNLHNIDLPSETASTVIALDTFEHVEYPYKAMAEIYRILKPDGMVILSSVMNFPIHDYPYDYWRYTPEAFKSLLKQFEHCDGCGTSVQLSAGRQPRRAPSSALHGTSCQGRLNRRPNQMG